MTVKSNNKKSKVKKNDEKTKKEETQIVDPEKQKAQSLISTLTKESQAFTAGWNGFQTEYKGTLVVVRKYHETLEQQKEEMVKHREKLLEKLRQILPTLKIRLGNDASKNKLAYVVATNLEGIEGASISSIRRLIDRYEEKFGPLFPKALEDKSTETDDLEAGTQNHIDISYDIFPKKRDEMLVWLDAIRTAVENNTFDRLIIKLNANRSKIKGFKIVVAKGSIQNEAQA